MKNKYAEIDLNHWFLLQRKNNTRIVKQRQIV